MATQAANRRLPTVRINDREVVAEPHETVLQAALRAGIDLPSGCRVGGCGACKCRLAEGEVREFTETGYLLTQEELDQRTILACQSVPRTNVHVLVDLPAEATARVRGVVIGRERLTHDIVRVRVRLGAELPFLAGQFVSLNVSGLPGVTRCYSFAAPPRDDREVSFIVRKVPGGQLSTLFVDADDDALLGRGGREVELSGVAGELTLRPGTGPLLFVAGGSGLGPLLALLQQAVVDREPRPITLYFGAREERDLYCMDELEALGRALPGGLRVVPVLAAVADGDAWAGERGLVTEKLPEHAAGAQAYLCGPPAMIDAALPALQLAGVAREDLHADRFTTQADAPTSGVTPAEPLPWALEALHTLKFSLFHLVGLAATASLLGGGWGVTAGLAGVLALYVLGDTLAGDDTTTPRLRHPKVLTAQLWLALPLVVLVVFTAVWSVSTGDPLGFGASLGRLTGHDFLAARDATSFGHHASGVVLTGLMIGMIGTIPAHELTHRTWDRTSMAIGRWLLAFSFDTSFAIEHVYGHHRYVSTAHDPATAPRGRNVYWHILASTAKGNVSAWEIEAYRLKKRKLPLLGWHNVFLRGHAMSAALVAAAWALGGPKAALYFVACALWGKALLEIVNYMEHYGMVREPSTPVAPRHSWNTNRRVSSWSMFNLTRHSHHHAAGEVPYHELRPYPDAPMMIHGYLATIVVALIPPLWHKLMTPKVLAWDRDHATRAERRLAALANARSGREAFAARTGGAVAGA